MQVIYKYELEITDQQEVETFKHAIPLGVANQNGHLVMWLMVDTAEPKVTVAVSIFGTGNPIDPKFWVGKEHNRYMGSVPMGIFVWHVFIRGNIMHH